MLATAIAALAGFSGTGLLAAAESSGAISFNDHIQPILSEHCFHCHGPDAESRKGELRLDRAEHAFQPRKDGGTAIVKGDPDASLLMRRITTADPKHVMPPPEEHKPLRAERGASRTG